MANQHFKYLSESNICGFVSVDSANNIVREYVPTRQPDVDDLSQFLRCRNIPTLSTSAVPVCKKQFIYQSREEIMIVHMREFLALKLPSIPVGFEGIYCIEDEFLDMAIAQSLRTDEVINEIPQLPQSTLSGCNNYFLRERLDVANELRHQIQISFGHPSVTFLMARISPEFFNLCLRTIPNAAAYLSSLNNERKYL
jgi:hypothetical protein